MNHLPRVAGAIRCDKVPCLCDPQSFDHGAFDTFPERKGYRLLEHDSYVKFIFNADGSRLDVSQLGSIAQAWLFFGLLNEFFRAAEISIRPEDFVETCGGADYITTSRLPDYIEQMNQAESVMPFKARKIIYQRQQELIMRAMAFRCYQFSDSGLHDGDNWHAFMDFPKDRYRVTLPLPIELSFSVLEQTLDQAARRSYGLAANGPGDPLLCRGLIEALPRDGWCPSEVSLVRQVFNDTSAFFASRLDRRRTKADHTSCSTNKCRAYDINTEEYQTRHAARCRGCAYISIKLDEIATVIRQNKTPRVQIDVKDTDKRQQVRLKVVDSGSFVAISHVWSDGLGNATMNALPMCQLIRLRTLAANQKDKDDRTPPAIWIDTLLVPSKKGVLKRVALARLSQYYREATKVLVLDSDLLHASASCSQEELVARVLFSTWMRRLWTLEEGILSRHSLQFQFNDRAVSMAELIRCGENPHRFFVKNTLCQILGLFLPDLADEYPPQAGDPKAQLNIINKLLPLLQYRLTTKAADEPLCISHILGLDNTSLLQYDEADLRMKELLKLLTDHGTLFPRSLLFTNEPKLKLPGTSWAPVSLMAFDLDDVDYMLHENTQKYGSYRPDKGLLVDGLDSLWLDFGDDTFKQVTFVEFDSRIYALTPTLNEERCQAQNRFYDSQAHEKALDPDTALHWSPECQQLLGTSPRTLAAVYASENSVLLVSMYHFEREPEAENRRIIHARPISRMHMHELKTPSQNYIACRADSDVIRFTNPHWNFEETKVQMHAELKKYHDPATSAFLRCKQGDTSQQWCIG